MEKTRFLSCLLLVLYTSADTSIPGLVKDFVHVETKMPWFFAKQYCIRGSGDLLSRFDENGMRFLNGSANQLSWIGASVKFPVWKWVDETNASYFNWFGECTAIKKNGWWFNMPCNTRLSFVCNIVSGGWVSIKESFTWHQAKLYCETYHAGLAFISNATDNGNVCALLNPDLYYWIGLATVTDLNPLNNQWRWVNNRPLTYSNWLTSFFCAVMDWRGFWYDRVCFEKNPFVCYRKTSNTFEYSDVIANKTWHEAQSHCKMLNMSLIMVKTQEEITALLRDISGFIRPFLNGYFWIGLYNDPWVWAGVNTVNIRNWNSMQPDGKDFRNQPISILQTCVATMNGEWYDEECSMPLPFFCSATVRSVILVSELKSWEEALKHCRERYVDLASVTSDVEQQVAVRKVREIQGGYVWTGLRFLAGSWFWVYGDNLEYENWLNGGWQQCPTHRCGALAVASGKWEARPCEERLNFLCFQK